MFGPFRANYFRILKLYFFKYIPAGYSSKPAVDISSDIDERIPEKAVVAKYMGMFSFPISLLAKAGDASRKNPKLAEDISRATEMLEKITIETCKIYNTKQSSFKRPASRNISVGLLHLFDRNRNCYPSLHAQVLAEIYNVFLAHPDIISKDRLILRTVQILEACFLAKQHSLKDIASGLAGVSILDPSFSQDKAKELMSHFFVNNDYGMDATLCADTRDYMGRWYAKIISESGSKSYIDALMPNN